MLACEDCGVLHHPACWVRNDGCSTDGAHRGAPHAFAYARPRPVRESIHAEPVLPGDPPGRPPTAVEPPPEEAPSQRPPVRRTVSTIDAEALARRPRHGAPYIAETERSRRPLPPPEASASTSPRLPSLYGRHRWLGYWYIPAALLLTAAVAGGVIYGIDALFGGDSEPSIVAPEVGVNDPATALTPTATSTRPPTATPTKLPPGATAPPFPAGKFKNGDSVAVTGTGGECLNMRSAPGIEAPVVACLPDDTVLSIIGGPESGGGLTWWRVQTPRGDGWAAEQYLVAKAAR